jgi:hypothetical protein
MFPEISYEFNARDYKSMFDILLKEREVTDTYIEYYAEVTLPIGDLSAQLYALVKSER